MSNIIIPRQRKIQVVEHDSLGVRGYLAGFIQIEKAKCDLNGEEVKGSRRIEVPWFHNVITDYGMDRKGMGNMGRGCVLGTGTSPITTTSLTLGSTLGKNNSIVNMSFQDFNDYGLQVASSPYYGWCRGIYRFNAGNCTGVLSEVGLTVDGAAGVHDIVAGSLIKDALGNPVTITKDVDELLDISYEVRIYAKMTDDTYVVNINGVDHTFTTRAQCTHANDWGRYSLNSQSLEAGFLYRGATLANIGSITQELQGTIEDTQISPFSGDSTAYSPYVPGTYFLERTFTIPPARANFTGGISGISLRTGVGAYKTVVSPAIPKVLGSTLVFRSRDYWSRYTLP